MIIYHSILYYSWSRTRTTFYTDHFGTSTASQLSTRSLLRGPRERGSTQSCRNAELSSWDHGIQSTTWLRLTGDAAIFVLWLLIWIGTCQVMAFLHENDDLPVLNHGLLEDHWFIWIYRVQWECSVIYCRGFRDFSRWPELRCRLFEWFCGPPFFSNPR